MTERIKKTKRVEAPASREEMERLVGEICERSINADSLRAAMDAELMGVRERYEPEIGRLSAAIDERMDRAILWASEHTEEFAARKSIVMVHGTVGYRTGMPTLKTLKGWTWAKVLAVLARAFPEFVRVKQEIDKAGILAAALSPDELAKVGVRKVQEETFYVEPLKTEAQ